MTLVVTKIIGDRIYINSDSKVTDYNAVRDNPLCGVLKTLILAPTVAISFAGRISYARSAIASIFSKDSLNLENLCTLLLGANIESNNETDFIVCSIIGGVPKILKVSDGQILGDLQIAWIGDLPAFDLFQRKRSEYIANGTAENEAQSAAFRAVIDSPEADSVAGYHVEVNSTLVTLQGDREGREISLFMYREKAELQSGMPFTLKTKKNQFVEVPMGNAQDGAYAISYLVSITYAYPGFVVHFLHGNLGVIYIPRLGIDGIKIAGVGGAQFVNLVHERIGVHLRGFLASGSSLQVIDTSVMYPLKGQAERPEVRKPLRA